MKAVCQLVGLVLLILVVLTALGTALFIGVGSLLSQWLALSLFQASILAIGASLAMTLVIYTIASMIHFHSNRFFENDWHNDDWEPNPDADGTPVFPQPDVPKVGRNAPCPCGSGKKYKNCCGK